MVDLLLGCFGCRLIVFGVLLIGVCLWCCWCIACLICVGFDFEWFVWGAALWRCFVVGFGVAWFVCLGLLCLRGCDCCLLVVVLVCCVTCYGLGGWCWLIVLF